uniref:Multiple inositol polyphosphate phosphatase 1 n=1 Tax=Kalanchoe fedtschenkoi TaxID=63787 RepID=A0A7N0U1G5_KALFE
MKNMTATIAQLALLILCISASELAGEEAFDVRNHLSTVTRYGAVTESAGNSLLASNSLEGCKPIHLNLLARHGTRSPTKKRIKELNNLSARIKVLLQGACATAKTPGWFWGWESPWKGNLKGGELISKGEEELYSLGIRVRERFSDLFDEEYHSDVYSIRATQVPRAAASAVAFGMGLFSWRGSLGPGRNGAFAISTESRASDLQLRFYDSCDNYKDFRKSQEPAVDELKKPILKEITLGLSKRYGLNFTRQDIASLWFLCKQEASLLNVTDQACGLFNPSEVVLLEWADDMEVFILKGYGKSLNYRMGTPLLEDVFQAMELAIKAREEGHPSGSYEKARLRFAHAETIVPFSCLLGLFLDKSEFERIQKELPLQLPPRPPQGRNWKASRVAPFAGNYMMVLHSCPIDTSSKYYVQVLHNEHPIEMPGCGYAEFCPFEVFKERIVQPHLKHNFNTVCNVKPRAEFPKSMKK